MKSGLRICRSSQDLRQCGSYEGSRYCSRWFQGLEAQMEWLRLTLESTGQADLRVYVREEAPDPFSAPETGTLALERRSKDVLLYGVRGRYLAFTVEPAEGLTGFQLEFPGRSIDEGLPAVLQRDEWLRALLGVYQSGYMDLNRQAAEFPNRMDPASEQMLPQLERWLGAARWARDAELRQKLLPRAQELARLRGTRKGLLLLSRLVTGVSCRIVEAWQTNQWEQLRHCRSDRTDSADAADVTILVPRKAGEHGMQQLKTLLPDFMPLGIRWRVIYLHDDSTMDGHGYLDENSAPQGNPVSIMDGREETEVLLE